MPSTSANSTIVGSERQQRRCARQFSMPVAAALEHAGQAAGLALEVEAQRQAVHVLEGLERELAHGVHRDLGEQPSRTCVSSAMAMRVTP